MKKITTSFALLGTLLLNAQGPLSLSLHEAMDLAAKQNYAVQSSTLESEKAFHRAKEVAAIGLPQINGSAEFNDFINVPTSLIPNFFSAEGPRYFPAQFGVPYGMKAGAQLTQLLFDGSYLVGLKAARELRTQSDEDLQRAQADARAQAAKAYYGVLAAEEGARLLGEGVPLLEKGLSDATAMQVQGFLETTDVDRLTIQTESAKSQQRSFQQQAEVARMLLALVLGLPQGTPVTLTDKLETLLNDPGETSLVDQPFDPATHIEQEYANTYVRLQELNLKNDKSKALPSLAGFFSHQQVWNGPELRPFGGPYSWYPTTLWGLQLNVPIFSSGMRYHKVQQTQLGLQQAKINLTATEQRLRTTAEQSRTQVRSAYDSFKTEERNMGLAKNIFERTTTKFNLGSAPSFELTTEQGNYLIAQRTYVQTLVQLLIARVDLRKALDLY